jgi:endonuclease YncB( thermonuclease family)
VEYFGKEASAFTKQLCEGKQVVLRDELGGQDRDKYDRLLRYVYLEDGTHVNAEIIKQGYGHASPIRTIRVPLEEWTVLSSYCSGITGAQLYWVGSSSGCFSTC